MSAYTHGSPEFTASQVTALPGPRVIFDQSGTPSWEYQYEGTAAGIAAQAITAQAAGARTVIDASGPINRLTATWVRNPVDSISSEVPNDVWSIDMEENLYSLFQSPRAIEEAGRYVNVAQYKSDIMEAAQAGDDFPLSQTEYPVGWYIYNLLSQGIDTAPVKSPVLRRNRTYSLTYADTPRRITYDALVYTRSALLSAFGIVSPLADRIPLDPAETLPEGFVWGWYLAQESYTYARERGGVKVQESLSFRFGKWNAWPAGSALQGLYTLVA